MKRISILGSTGSIGRNCLRVIEQLGPEFRVVGLAAGSNVNLMAEQIQKFRPSIVSVTSRSSVEALSSKLRQLPTRFMPRIVSGPEGICEVATHSEANLLISAIVGISGLLPTHEAILLGKTIALANKEILVVAGQLVTKACRQNKVEIIPVDSEHNAVHQCLRSGRREEVARIILTASGGPFRTYSSDKLKTVTPQMALNHPTWNMGNRITIDSATLMNKGFEILEAKWLFEIPVERISVLIHPQSTVHSMVEFVDGSIIAQLGATDMRHPIQYALTHPKRVSAKQHDLTLDKIRRLEFMEPDMEKFRCLALAYRAASELGASPCTLNAADEVAVDAFLKGKISFLGIPKVVERMLDITNGERNLSTVQKILEYDGNVRRETQKLIECDYLGT